MLITSLVHAEPLYIHNNATPSIWPLMAALALSAMFVGSIFTPWAVLWGSIPIGIAVAIWFWPTRKRATTGPFRTKAAS